MKINARAGGDLGDSTAQDCTSAATCPSGSGPYAGPAWTAAVNAAYRWDVYCLIADHGGRCRAVSQSEWTQTVGERGNGEGPRGVTSTGALEALAVRESPDLHAFL